MWQFSAGEPEVSARARERLLEREIGVYWYCVYRHSFSNLKSTHALAACPAQPEARNDVCVRAAWQPDLRPLPWPHQGVRVQGQEDRGQSHCQAFGKPLWLWSTHTQNMPLCLGFLGPQMLAAAHTLVHR